MKYKYKKDERRLLHKFSTETEGGGENMTIQGTPRVSAAETVAIQTTLEPLQPQFPHLLLILLMKISHHLYLQRRQEEINIQLHRLFT